MRHRFRLRFSVLTIMIVIALLAGGFAWLRPLTADEAVRIAERFVRENGYTDFTPDDPRNSSRSRSSSFATAATG